MQRTPLLIVATALLAGVAGFGASRWLDAESRTRLASEMATAVASEARGRLPPAKVGDPVPIRALPDIAGNMRTLDDFPGQTLVVNFWAPWCKPCLDEIPLLKRFDASRKDITVVGIALDEPDRVEAWMESLVIDYPVLLDEPGPRDYSVALGNHQGVLPYTVLVSPDGRLVAVQIGDFESQAELEQWLESADRSMN